MTQLVTEKSAFKSKRPAVFTRRLTRERMRHGRLVEWRQFGGRSTVGMLVRRPVDGDPEVLWLVSLMAHGVMQQRVPWPAVERGEFFVAPPRALGEEEVCALGQWFLRELADA